MTLYKTEDNINFYDELYKSLDDPDDEDDANLCQITGSPLINHSVTLECNHHFNYHALYTEICRQKYHFKTYDILSLSNKDKVKYKNSGFDYFIKCPYCRTIQFTILPYYQELGFEQKYGVNSLDKTLQLKTNISNNYSMYYGDGYGSDNYTFKKYGLTFKKGICCYNSNFGNECAGQYVSLLPNTNVSYCKYHYRSELKKYNLTEKKKIVDKKNKEKEILKSKKEELLNERKQLFEQKNIERAAKGLPLLKRLPILQKKITNIVEQQNNLIPEYVPENNEEPKQGCTTILKFGPNKGKPCCCKIVNENGVCKRHDLHTLN